MSLSKLQWEFAQGVSSLIAFASLKGYMLTFGDAYRDPRLHGAVGVKKGYGSKNSVHKKRLAVDFNLFVDGEYITDSGHEAFVELGNYWKSIHELARWGGDFSKPDGNHFSFEYMGFM